MGKVPHVTTHTSIMAAVLATNKAFVCCMWTDFLEYAAYNLVGKTRCLIRTVVAIGYWGVIVPRLRCSLFRALEALESLEEAHDLL